MQDANVVTHYGWVHVLETEEFVAESTRYVRMVGIDTNDKPQVVIMPEHAEIGVYVHHE